jgi:hypothetical protein
MLAATWAQSSLDGERVGVFDPSADVHGASYGEWSARHWQWTTSFPLGMNPGQDATGALCGAGQHGPVFFLPRNLPPCVVPEGMPILVPLPGAECSMAEPAPYTGDSEAELAACAAADADRYANIVISINGTAIPDIGKYRVATEPFTLMLPEENILAAPAGATTAVADGYLVILEPLPAGEHDLVVSSELADGTVLPEANTTITVVAPDDAND